MFLFLYNLRSILAVLYSAQYWLHKLIMQDFDDIRPYNDSELKPTISNLLANSEFIGLITRYRFPIASRILVGPFSSILKMIVERRIRGRFGDIRRISEMQNAVEAYMDLMLARTSDGFSVSGLEHLQADKPHLFLSNHRDITLDPAFTNLALHRNGRNTVRIAIGDNLLSKPWASDLMRLNKSFIVKRSITKPRELLKALVKLSHYIKHSLDNDGENVWLAHREGRAKDGVDKTDLAVLKMIFLAKPKDKAFSVYLNELSIVPISIAYEFDPCIAMKAKELRIMQRGKEYRKSEHEDLDSIGQGIAGYKGRIHLAFSPSITQSQEVAENEGLENIASIDQLEVRLDQDIIKAFRLFPSNLIAYEKIYGSQQLEVALKELQEIGLLDAGLIEESASADYREKFEGHINLIDSRDREIALQSYANAVVSKLSLKT